MRVGVRATALGAALMLSTVALADMNTWTAIGPSGGQVNKIAFNPNTPNIVYALSAGGFQRSTDGGVSWQLVQAAFLNAPVDLAIDPANPSRIYIMAPGAGSGLSFFLSTDAGVTLNPVQVFPAGVDNGSHVQVSQDGRTVCATGDMRIFCSTDAGQTWTERAALGNTGWSVFKLLMDPTNAKTLYAAVTFDGRTGTLLVSHDGAASWQQLTSTPTGSLIVDLAVSAAHPAQIWAARTDGLWMSADSGATWTGLADPRLSTYGTNTVVIDPTNPAILYAGTGCSGCGSGAVLSSSDLGANWTDVSANLSVAAVTTIAVDPSKNSHLLAGGQAGLAGTATSGSSWSPQTAGLIATQILSMTADAVADRIYVGTYTGSAYYFAGGGGTPTAVNGVTAQAIYALPGLSGTLLAAGFGPLSKSTDGGNTWSTLLSPSGGYLQTFASSPGAPQTVVATSSGNAPFRSVDAGTSWTAVTAGLPSAPVVGRVAASSSDPMTMYMGVGSSASGGNTPQPLGVYRSTDAGQTWNPVNNGISTTDIVALAVDPTNSQIVYATTDSTLVKTTDGGSSWTSTAWSATFGTGTPFALTIDPAHPQILYAAGVGAVGRSVDGGNTWESLRSGPLPPWSPQNNALLVDPNRPSNVLVGTLQSGVQVITIAPDLALQVNAPPSLAGVALSAQYAYTITNNGPFHATGVQAVLSTPAGTQNPSATASAGSCTTAGTVVTCSIGILHTGASATINLSATPAQVGTFQINGTVQADEPDSDPTNNSVTTTQTVAAVADLVVSAAGPASAHVGDQLTYTITVQNTGPSTATAAVLIYQLASGLAAGTVTSSSGTCSTSPSALITCSLGDVADSKSVTVTVGASASQAGTQASMATVTTTAYDPAVANDSASTSTLVSAVSPVSSGGGGGGGGGGGALSPESVLALLALLARQVYRRRVNARPVAPPLELIGAAGRS